MIRRALACASVAALVAAANVWAADGDLDPTFHGDGLFVWGTAATDPWPVDALLGPDGALVVVGRADSGTPDGFDWRRLDDAGQASACLYDPPSSLFAQATSATFDWQGRLIVAGVADYTNLGRVAAVARFLYPACTLDTSFDGDGYATFDAASDLAPIDVAALFVFDGSNFLYRIVLVAGWGSSATTFALVSLRDNGTPDPGFDGDGLKLYTLGAPVTQLRAIGLEAVGTRLLVGAQIRSGDADFYVVAFDATTGAVDTGWAGGTGWRLVDVDGGSSDLLFAMTRDRAGRLLLVGQEESGSAAEVARLTAAGGLDPTLDGDGRLVLPLSAIHIGVAAAAVDSAGRIVLAGRDFEQALPRVGAVRLSDAGELDATYGEGGSALHLIDVFPETDDAAGVKAVVLWGGRATLVGAAWRSTDEVRGFAARLASALVFRDGFERGSAGGWTGF